MAPAINRPARRASHGNLKLTALHAAIANAATGSLQSTRFDPPVRASVELLDAALRQVRSGGTARYCIQWDRDPNEVFGALEEGGELPPSLGAPRYFMEVSADIPELVCCTRLA